MSEVEVLNTQPKPFVFVLMPFADDFDDTYLLGIKPACNDVGAYCERVDEQLFDETILERIYNQIDKADLIVSDMTGRNPNVFYETGYAHALGKRVILLTQNSDDIPYDLKLYRHIVYEGSIVGLKDELERSVKWYLERPDASVSSPIHLLEFYIERQEISEGVDIPFPGKRFIRERIPRTSWTANVELLIHNTSDHMLDASNVYLTLVFPEEAERSRRQTEDVFQLPDGRLNTGRKQIGLMLPDDWSTSSFFASFANDFIKAGPIPVELRIISPIESRTLAFSLSYDPDV